MQSSHREENRSTTPMIPIPEAFGIVTLALAVAGAAWLPAARADELKEGKAALAAGQLDEAQRLFEKAASQGRPKVAPGVGQVWLKRRQYDKAREAFELAQKMDPLLAVALLRARASGEASRASATPRSRSTRRRQSLDRKFRGRRWRWASA
jgi:tetratricopeptide (TPR) repeat protein